MVWDPRQFFIYCLSVCAVVICASILCDEVEGGVAYRKVLQFGR